MKKVLSTVVVIITLAFLLCGFCACSKYSWPQTELASMIPEPKHKIVSLYDHADSISVRIKKVSDKEFSEYVSQCKQRGFIIDSKESSKSYKAYNEEGYFLDLDLYYDKEMQIDLDAPIKMAEFIWPDTTAGKLVPQPENTFGKVEWSYDNSFLIYIGNMFEEGFSDYVQKCKAAGFTLDQKSRDNYYYAYNPEGYSLSIEYKGFNTVSIHLYSPKDTDPEVTNDTSSDPDDATVSEPVSDVAESPEVTSAPTTEASTENNSLYYTTNDLETAKSGNSGVFSYKKSGSYDIYWIIDFDEGYVYYFTNGNGETTCMRVKIVSGDLNSYVLITYTDGSDTWDEALSFKWKNQPDHLVWQDSDYCSYDFYPTDLEKALKLRDSKTIIDY